jgi:ketosteroid isomerase-like protein
MVESSKAIGKTVAAVIVAIIVAAALGGVVVLRSDLFAAKSNTGYLTLAAQDPGPIVGVQLVYVEASEVQVHSTNGTWITVLDAPTWVKLNYVLNTTTDFATSKLQSGSYNQINIVVPPSGVKVTVNASAVSLPLVSVKGLVNVTANVPSGAQTGIKIYAPFTIEAGASETVVLHFHLIQTGEGEFMLTPQTNAETNTSSTQLVAQLFNAHLSAIGSKNTAQLESEYSSDANVSWLINQSTPLTFARNTSGTQSVEAGWQQFFAQFNVSKYTFSVSHVNVTGNTATATGTITLIVKTPDQTVSLTLYDDVNYSFNGQVWQLTQESVT